MFRKRSTHYIYALAALAGAIFCEAETARSATVPRGQVISGYNPATGLTVPVQVDANGRPVIVGGTSGGTAYGPDAQGTAPTQPPIDDGCIFNSTLTSVLTGQIIRLQCDAFGRPIVVGAGTSAAPNGGAMTVTGGLQGGDASNYGLQIGGNDGTHFRILSTDNTGKLYVIASGTVAVSGTVTANQGTPGASPWLVAGNVTPSDTFAPPSNAVPVFSFSGLFDGANFNRWRSVIGASAGTGLGTAAVDRVPSSNANVGLVPVTSTAYESSHVLDASPGNLYRVRITTKSNAGYLMIFNAVSPPADGAVQPASCTAVAANATTDIDGVFPSRYTVGITAVFSIGADCVTKTASATAFFEGLVK